MTTLLDLISLRIYSVKLSKAVYVLKPVRKPDCNGNSRFEFSRFEVIWSVRIWLNTLAMCNKSEIGRVSAGVEGFI